jgi:hypothetical protein
MIYYLFRWLFEVQKVINNKKQPEGVAVGVTVAREQT